jgi:transposase-like protein
MLPSGRSPHSATPLGSREQLGIRKRRDFRARPALGPWVVRSQSGAERLSFDKAGQFAAALRTAMSEARDIEMLFALWEQNVETVRAINRSLSQQHLTNQASRHN